MFHYVLKNMRLDIPIEIFQETNNPDLIIGLMTFLSDELNFKLNKFTQSEKENFKIKVDEFLSTIRTDYRTGLRVGYVIISEKGHYGAKYFVKTNTDDFDKEKLLKILELVKSIYTESELFLNTTLNN
ncbi:MAG: hypothetical protein HW410_1485 [Nitrosarchaeum sp.]|nr:hypothetical protein [Nitrosarchaeum sp.]